MQLLLGKLAKFAESIRTRPCADEAASTMAPSCSTARALGRYW